MPTNGCSAFAGAPVAASAARAAVIASVLIFPPVEWFAVSGEA
jgi:hypothetical protein